MKALCCAVFLITALDAAVVRAQSPDPPSDARVHLGSFQLTPSVTLQDMGYDSNVFNSSTDRRGDFTFVATPHVDGVGGSSRATVSFKAATEFVYFAKHATERGVNIDLAGGTAVNVGRVTLSARGTYLNTRRRPNEEIDARVRRLELSGDAGVRVALFGKISVDAGTRMFSTEYDDTAVFDDTFLAETLDHATRTAYAGVRYGLTPLTTVSVGMETIAERFSRSPMRDSDSKVMYGAIEFNPRARLSGTARAGYQWFKPATPAVSSFSGIVGSAVLGYRLRETTQVGVSLDRRPLYSYAPQQPYFVWESIGATLLRSLTSTATLEIRVRRNWYRYRALATSIRIRGLGVFGRIDTWSEMGVAVRHQVNRNLESNFQLTHWVRDSDAFDYEHYNGLRIGTTMLFRF